MGQRWEVWQQENDNKEEWVVYRWWDADLSIFIQEYQYGGTN